MTHNLNRLPFPLEPNLTDFDYMIAANMDMIVDEVPPEAVEDLCGIAETAEEYFYGMQATIELDDLVKDHYAQEPQDGTEDYRWKDDNIQDDHDPEEGPREEDGS